MLFSQLAKTIVGTALFLSVSFAQAATYTFVGEWSVHGSGAPDWLDPAYEATNGPLAYTAQEAAALIFGGSASDYVISTVDNNPLNVNFSAWYAVLGYQGTVFAQDYSNKFEGQYYGPLDSFNSGNPNNAASAYVRDYFVAGSNYAFRVTPVPEPENMALLLAGGAVVGFARRRKHAV